MQDSKIAIVGYGVDGKSTAEYFAAKGATVTVVDQNVNTDAGEHTAILGDEYLDKLLDVDYDLIIRSSGFPVKILKDSGVGEWSTSYNYFMQQCASSNIIGVTGTKGKGTTATLVSKFLETTGHTVWLLGNIGTPFLSALDSISPEDYVVLELSSFQLMDAIVSPRISVVLNIEEDHQNWHSSMEEYVAAKANITRFQTDTDLLIYDKSNQLSSSIAGSSPAQKIALPDENLASFTQDHITFNQQNLIARQELKIFGDHMAKNICMAIVAATNLAAIPVDQLQTVLKDYRGLPHRLQFVREVSGVQYFDDSYATMPGATVAALHAFQTPRILILGGVDKKVDNRDLVKEVVETAKYTVLIGENAQQLVDLFNTFTYNSYHRASDLQEAVRVASLKAVVGDTVLFSPGTSSFDMFKNASDRGEQFADIVCSL